MRLGSARSTRAAVNAMLSGRMAASTIARLLAGEANDLRGYERELNATIEQELRVARQLSNLFHQRPWPYVQILQRSPFLWRSLCRIVRGESDYRSFRARLGRLRR